MMNRILFLTMAAMTMLLSSCFKDEPLNAEADILQVSVNMPEEYVEKTFFNNSDASKEMLSNADTMAFMIRENADVSAVKLDIKITDGATISPAFDQPFDFSDNKKQYFTVTSQDGQWQRTYAINFEAPKNIAYYSFDNPKVNTKPEYYFWDDMCSANGGFMFAKSSAKKDEYPTVYDPDGYIGSCIKLRTISTGSWGQTPSTTPSLWRPLAAGNLFFGAFDTKLAMNSKTTLQATRFGVPVSKLPVSFSGFYKYKAGEVVTNRSLQVLEGVVDEPAIYAVIYKNHDAEGKEIVLTGEDIMTSPYRVGLAKFYNVPATDTWTRFDLKFEYWEEIDPEVLANMGYSMAMVCSASQNGDLFEGAAQWDATDKKSPFYPNAKEGSVLWIDEISFIYE